MKRLKANSPPRRSVSPTAAVELAAGPPQAGTDVGVRSQSSQHFDKQHGGPGLARRRRQSGFKRQRRRTTGLAEEWGPTCESARWLFISLSSDEQGGSPTKTERL